MAEPTVRERAFAIIERFVALEREGGLSDKGFAAVLIDQLAPLLAAPDQGVTDG